jgi:hypothetical protein
MKKAILTIGLFTLVLVSTSFASPKKTTSLVTAENTGAIFIDGNGGQSNGDNRKVDYNGKSVNNQIIEIDGNGGQSIGDNTKVD